jgi:Ca-activated chloride channel family protein
MSGEKIAQARRAAIAAIGRLQDRDVVSVVLYNSSVDVLVPATKATDRDQIIQKIRAINASGRTALFAGVSKGAAEVRKFLDQDSVNRVILLSDGLANVGPKSPRELQRLGTSLVKEGISVSTLGLGLGYNEDLMSGLAAAGSGNHVFVQEADDMIAVFNNEFNDLMSVVASEFRIIATVAPGVRPVRVLGTEADITGREIQIPLAQLYANQNRYFVLEVEVGAGDAGETRPLVAVDVEYHNLITDTLDKLASSVQVNFSDSAADVEADRDLETFAYCTVQLANERNRRATALRDAGNVEQAQQLLRQNTNELLKCAELCKDKEVDVVIPTLEFNIGLNSLQAENIDDDVNWRFFRKSMRAAQSFNQAQQSREFNIPGASQSVPGKGAN